MPYVHKQFANVDLLKNQGHLLCLLETSVFTTGRGVLIANCCNNTAGQHSSLTFSQALSPKTPFQEDTVSHESALAGGGGRGKGEVSES